jgi:hypothetical protein
MYIGVGVNGGRYRCSVSKSRSFVRSTWPVFMRTCVVARLTPFLKPATCKTRCFRDKCRGVSYPSKT